MCVMCHSDVRFIRLSGGCGGVTDGWWCLYCQVSVWIISQWVKPECLVELV